VIAADHPDRAVVLQDATGGLQPLAGELVVGGEALELVPVVVDRVDLGIVGTQQVAAQLQIVGGSAKIRSTDFSGRAFICSMQSPRMMVSGPNFMVPILKKENGIMSLAGKCEMIRRG